MENIRKYFEEVETTKEYDVIDHIDVDDGRVVSITFKNGIEHRFIYKA